MTKKDLLKTKKIPAPKLDSNIKKGLTPDRAKRQEAGKKK